MATQIDGDNVTAQIDLHAATPSTDLNIEAAPVVGDSMTAPANLDTLEIPGDLDINPNKIHNTQLLKHEQKLKQTFREIKPILDKMKQNSGAAPGQNSEIDMPPISASDVDHCIGLAQRSVTECTEWLEDAVAKSNDPRVMKVEQGMRHILRICAKMDMLVGEVLHSIRSSASSDDREKGSKAEAQAQIHDLESAIKTDMDVAMSTDEDPQHHDPKGPLETEDQSVTVESDPASVNDEDLQPPQQDKGKGKGPEYGLEALHISH